VDPKCPSPQVHSLQLLPPLKRRIELSRIASTHNMQGNIKRAPVGASTLKRDIKCDVYTFLIVGYIQEERAVLFRTFEI
jgi:hypothetical protein